MAYAPTRSMNSELAEGMTDAKFKKIVQDRGGFVEEMTYRTRGDLDDINHGIHEKDSKVLPDGRISRTPNFMANPTVDLTQV